MPLTLSPTALPIRPHQPQRPEALLHLPLLPGTLRNLPARVHDLCIAIGLGAPIAIMKMRGGGYNRIIGPTLPNDLPAITHIPRFGGYMLQGIHNQYAVTSFLRKTEVPVPETIAYNATIGNQIESEYTIQRRIPGVTLEGIYHGLDMDKKEHVLGQVIDLLAEMENIHFPTMGQLVAMGFLPNALILGGNNQSYGAGRATTSYPTRYINSPNTGPRQQHWWRHSPTGFVSGIQSMRHVCGRRRFHGFRKLSLR